MFLSAKNYFRESDVWSDALPWYRMKQFLHCLCHFCQTYILISNYIKHPYNNADSTMCQCFQACLSQDHIGRFRFHKFPGTISLWISFCSGVRTQGTIWHKRFHVEIFTQNFLALFWTMWWWFNWTIWLICFYTPLVLEMKGCPGDLWSFMFWHPSLNLLYHSNPYASNMQSSLQTSVSIWKYSFGVLFNFIKKFELILCLAFKLIILAHNSKHNCTKWWLTIN